MTEVFPIPLTVDILGREYQIYTNENEWPGDQENLHELSGCHIWSVLAIFVNPKLPLTEMKATLVHEIIHSLVNYGAWGDDDNVKLKYKSAEKLREIIPTSIDSGLVYVLEHNPDLVRYLTQ